MPGLLPDLRTLGHAAPFGAALGALDRVARRRHALAAALVVSAAALLLLPAPAQPGTPAVVAARDLPAGRTVGPDDVRLEPRTDPLPATAVRDPAGVHGRVVALPVSAGELVTGTRLVGRPLLDALSSDGVPRTAVAVPLDGDALAAVVRPGDVVDVLASGEAGSGGAVVHAGRVLIAPGADEGVPAARAGPAEVVLAVRAHEATAVARAAATARLRLALRTGTEPDAAAP